jgi:hypothetical protein
VNLLYGNMSFRRGIYKIFRKKSFDLFQEIPVEDIDERQRCIDEYLRQMKLEMLRKEDDIYYFFLLSLSG